MPPAVSWVLNQPSAAFVTEAGAFVKVAGGKVMMAAVSVYVGNRLTGTSAADIVVGSQGNWEVEEAGIEDGVPVCHG